MAPHSVAPIPATRRPMQWVPWAGRDNVAVCPCNPQDAKQACDEDVPAQGHTRANSDSVGACPWHPTRLYLSWPPADLAAHDAVRRGQLDLPPLHVVRNVVTGGIHRRITKFVVCRVRFTAPFPIRLVRRAAPYAYCLSNGPRSYPAQSRPLGGSSKRFI